MMKSRSFLTFVLACFSCVILAQKKQVLFTIDDSPYYTDEFLRIYNKNLDLVKDESQKDIDNYLELYLAYKMKVKKAYKLGLDKEEKYLNELKSYRNQLAKNYLSDTEITDELVQEAYDRSLKEVRASHILVAVDPTDSPEDTLRAYQKIQWIRKQAIKGVDFGELAEEFSDDVSAKDNQGDLGYFSVFKMVYPFESGVYNTKIDEISKPIRSNFGYHIVKVNDIRDSRGGVTVAHIMLNKSADDVERSKSFYKIKTIHQKLVQGEDFESLAKQFSEDRYSAEKGGNIGYITSGQLSSTIFEDAAFSIKNVGEYTSPVETGFGWHIIKLLEKHPVKSFDQAKADIMMKLQTSDRSKVIDENINQKLKAKYKPKVNRKLLEKMADLVTDDYYKNEFIIPENIEELNKTVLTIQKKELDGKAFFAFVKNQQNKLQHTQPLFILKDHLVKEFVNFSLNEYRDEDLENEFPEFKYIMEEYKDGLLLFDLMEREIWQRAQTDTLGLKAFYEENTKNYNWNERIDAVVASSVKRDFVEQTKKYFEEGKSVDFIKAELNEDAIVNIMIDEGFYEEKSNGLPKEYQLKKGVSKVFKDGDYYYVILGKELVPSSPKTFEEARSRAINDYQQYLESRWIDTLKEEFTYKIKQKTLDKVKQELEKTRGLE